MSSVKATPQPLCVVAATNDGELLPFCSLGFRDVVDLGPDGRPLSGEVADALRPALQQAQASAAANVVELPQATFTLSPIFGEGGRVVAVLVGAGPPVRTGIEPAAALPGSAERVLVVAAGSELRTTLSAMLASHWAVEVAASTAEALEQVGRRPPDLALVDSALAGQHGNELLRSLRQDPRTRGLPI